MEDFKTRFDYLGKSTDTKPMDGVDGSTFYEVDTSAFFIFYDGQWFEQE